MRFRRAQHVRRTAEFEVVRTQGKRRDCGAFLLHLKEWSETERPPVRRLGAVASKRVGNAVERARAKRLLREVFREQQQLLPKNCDVVLTARKAILRFDLETCRRRFAAAVHQLSLEKSREVAASNEEPEA
jgi:ribonuclease P protein component